VALALALLTLATILLNAGVFWLLLKKTEEQRRTDFALSLSGALTSQLEVETVRQNGATGYKKVLAAYQGSGLEADELYVVDPSMTVLAGTVGDAPRTPDAGLRAALYGKEQHTEVDGLLWGRRWVVVTTPVAPRGQVAAALRVRMPLHVPMLPGGPAGFVLAYTVFSGSAIALFGFSLFRRRLILPIRRLQEGTRRIADGGFGSTVQVDASRELQELSEALNAMSESLAGYRTRSEDQLERLRAANDELRATQEALVRSERLAGVGRLAAGLAHEVGNPLAAVLGYLELLDGGLDDPDLEADLVRRSQKELGRIHAIIRQLLDYSRTGAGQEESVSLVDAAEEAVATVLPQPAFRGVAVRVAPGEGSPVVRVERDKLHQVLVNLLLNAGDALAGAESPSILLEVGVDGAEARLRCLDTGSGFDGVALDRAFEPFFTTREVGRGTGLGLATALQVVEQAGGRMWVANRPEGGAEVGFALPLAAGGPDAA
jgi:C4-dicarboxylate-specific signal transduction histidine kinase